MNHVRRALFAVVVLAGMLALFDSDAANIQYGFTQGAAYPTGLSPSGIDAEDLNGDGVVDVVTADAVSNSISVLLGNADGTYQPRKVYPVGRNPSDVKLARLEGPTKPWDAIVTNNDDNTITIWWGDGKGGFTTSTLLQAGNGPHRITTGDMDDDGNLDIIVVNWTGTSATIFYGDGQRHFTTKNLPSWGAPDSIAVGDLTGDGRLDVVIGGERETVYINQGGRTFAAAPGGQTPGVFFPGFHSDSVAIVPNLKGGLAGVVSISQHESVLNILYGLGGGQLDDNTNDIVTYGVSGGATHLLMQDVNGDGIPDAIVSYAGSPAISVLIGTADGHFLARTDSIISTGVDHFVSAELNHNGDVDLIGASSASSTIVLFYGNPGIALGAPNAYPVGNSPTGIAVGDLNGDKNPDLVTVNTVDNTISVLLGSTNGNYGSRTDFSVGTSPRRVRLADFNGDGNLDAATANSGSGNVTVLLGTGTGIFGAQASYPAGTSPTDLVIADLHNTTTPDIAVADPGSGSVITLINSGTGTFTAGSTIPVSGTPFAIAAGDFENTGNQDLVVSEFTGNKIEILHNDGAGNFTVKATYAVGTSPDAIVVGDFNGDKHPDIAVANFGSGSVTVLLNDGSGNFTVSQTVIIAGKGSTSANQATSVQPVAIIAADMNDDGLLDLVTTNNEGSISVLIGNGTGQFNSQSTLLDVSGPSETVAADMNGDGRLDLATADKTTSTVAVRLTSATNAPVANDVALALDTKNASFTTGTLSAVSQTNGTLVYQLLSTPANGKVVLVDAAAGTFTYTPNSNFTGTDSFTYEALSGSLPSNQASVTIVVTNSGSGAYSWLLLVLLAAFVACRKFMTRPRDPSGAAA